MIKAIFFDLDGVLTTDKTGSITTSKYIAKISRANFNDLYNHKRMFDTNLDSGKVSATFIWESVCNKLGIVFNKDWLIEAYKSTPIDDKMLNFALQLKKDFKIIGIITDNLVSRLNMIVKKNKLFEEFDIIVVSERVKCTKAGTEIFGIAVEQAEIKPNECIFIDNSQKNINSAKKAGFHAVHFDDERRDYKQLFDNVEKIIRLKIN